MKILVDEMPKSGGSCIFYCYILGTEKHRCELDGFICDSECPKTCTYLAKGVVINELAGKEDGEKATGETAESNLA